MTLKVPEVEGTVQSNKVPVSASLTANGLTNGALKLKPKLNGSSEPFLPNTAGASLSSSSSPIESTIPIPVLDPDACELPLADHLLRRSELTFEQYPPSKAELFERHLQLRMTQVGLMEVFEGAEGAEQGWLDVFAWVADKRGAAATADGASGASQPRQSLDGLRRSIDRLSADPAGIEKTTSPTYPGLPNSSSETGPRQSLTVPPPIPIMISPATPDAEKMDVPPPPVPTADSMLEREKEDKKERDVRKERKASSGLHPKSKRSSSIERDRGDTSKSKKVGQMLKNRVDKGRAGITAVSRKIGHGVVKNGPLRRSSSTPDFAVVFQQTSYQASSIHSRRRLSSIIHSQDRTPNDSPPPPPPPPPPSVPPSTNEQDFKFRNKRSSRENRLLSDLWLMSAATFRRLGKIEQAKGSIQEAEVKDENNPNVWVQLGLYYVALGHYRHAIDTFQKALFISSEEVSATVHLSRLYLDPDISAQLRIPPNATTSSSASSVKSNSDDFSSYPDVDLAAGILAHLTKGRAWDVPEAWYFLAKAYGLQGRKAEERETLKLALELSEKRAVRDIGLALGWLNTARPLLSSRTHYWWQDPFMMIAGSSIFILVGAALLSAAQQPSISVQVLAPASGMITGLSIINITVRITNTGPTHLTILNDPISPLTTFPTNIFTLINQNNGRQAQFVGVAVKYAPDIAILNGGFTSLEPGDSVEAGHNLANAYDFSASGPGTYSVDISPTFLALDALNQTFSLTASVFSSVLSLTNTLGHDLQTPVVRSALSSDTTLAKKRHFVKRASYIACSPLHRIYIQQAVAAAQKYASEAYSYTSEHHDMATESPRYLTWFGAYDAERYDTVFTHFTNINADDFSSFTYYCDCLDPTAYAYVSPDKYGEIHLCDAFWLAPVTGKDSKAGTLIHEASHFTRNGGTEDEAYGTDACQTLAANNPDMAVRNADSHEYFVENPTGLA
ncbi:hypothetical protein NLJ89_g6955 [Agrocybe chaxingu]|uniref:Lysine-specific metallo-endopeptidase domain-containing protein n=1 Tax=Agrocybe chaxingu TaxID=84603 RepID=A0A9W8JX99_9AGAR|nr:hypothetical protein NLJ89_g6955 [Agrocybe chaxingu]